MVVQEVQTSVKATKIKKRMMDGPCKVGGRKAELGGGRKGSIGFGLDLRRKKASIGEWTWTQTKDLHVSESEARDDHMEVAKEEFEPEAEGTGPQEFPPKNNL